MKDKPVVFKPTTLHAARQVSIARGFFAGPRKGRQKHRVYNGTVMRLVEGPITDIVSIVEPPASLIIQGGFSDYRTPYVDYMRSYIAGPGFGEYFPFRADWCYNAVNTNLPYADDPVYRLPFFSWKYSAPDPSVFRRSAPNTEWVENKLDSTRTSADAESPDLRPEDYVSYATEYAFFIGYTPENPFEQEEGVTVYKLGEGAENEDPSEPYFLSWMLAYEEDLPSTDRTVSFTPNSAQSILISQDHHFRLSKYDINPDSAYLQGKPSAGNSIFDQAEDRGRLYYDFKFYGSGASRTYRIYENFVYEEFGYFFLTRGYSAYDTYFDNAQYYTDDEGNIYANEQEGYAGESLNCKPSAVMRGVYLELFLPVYTETSPTYIDIAASDYNHGELLLLYLKFQVLPKPEESVDQFPEEGWRYIGSSVLSLAGTNAEQTTFPDGSGKLVPSGMEVTVKPTGDTLSGYVTTVVKDHQGSTDGLSWIYDADLVTVYETGSTVYNCRVDHYAVGYISVDSQPDSDDVASIEYEDVVSWSFPEKTNDLAENSFVSRDLNNEGKKIEVHTQPHVFVKNVVRTGEGQSPQYKAILMLKGYEIHPPWESAGANRSLLDDTGYSEGRYAIDSGTTIAIDGTVMYLSAPYPKPSEFESLGVPLDGWGDTKLLRTTFVQPVEFCLVNSDTTRVLFYQKDRSEFLTRSIITPSGHAQEVNNLSDSEAPDAYLNPPYTTIYPYGVLEGVAYKRDVPKYFTYDREDGTAGFEAPSFEESQALVTDNHRYGVTVGTVEEEIYDEELGDYLPPIFVASYWEADYTKYELFEPSTLLGHVEFKEYIRQKYVDTSKGGRFFVPYVEATQFSGDDYIFIFPRATNVTLPRCYLIRPDVAEVGEQPTVSRLLIGEFYGLAVSYRDNGIPRL